MRSKLSEFIARMALAAIVLVAVAACDRNDEGKAAGETAPAAPASESGSPARQPTAQAPANETVPAEIETAARKLLADELDAIAGDFKLASSEGVEWSDASLGCPKEGHMYAQVITPGYKLIFDLAGSSHAVHSNTDGSHMVLCADGG